MLNKEKANLLLSSLVKDFPKNKEGDIVNEIFYDRCNTIDKIVFSNTGYKNYIDKLKELYDKLENSNANKSIIKLVDKYIDLSSENFGCTNQLFYRIGFKDGLTILLSALEGDDVNAVYNKSN